VNFFRGSILVIPVVLSARLLPYFWHSSVKASSPSLKWWHRAFTLSNSFFSHNVISLNPYCGLSLNFLRYHRPLSFTAYIKLLSWISTRQSPEGVLLENFSIVLSSMKSQNLKLYLATFFLIILVMRTLVKSFSLYSWLILKPSPSGSNLFLLF